MIDPTVAVGDVIAGKYAVERLLARGGSGFVVEARHLVLRDACAIKILLPAALEVPGARDRFLGEAQAIARLHSDHVVKIFDVGELSGGTPYMVMELLQGTDLQELVARRGPLPVGEAALYTAQICSALAETHALGIVHRDLKPANVVVTRGEGGTPRAKLIDFGISKSIRDPEAYTTLDGAPMGTPLFMAPEQLLGDTIDTRCDIWALGVTLYFLLTARLPFGGEATVRSMAAILSSPPAPPSSRVPSIPTRIDRLILRCLEKDPSRRPASVDEIAAALAPFTMEAAPPSRVAPPSLSPAQARLALAISLAAVAAAIGIGAALAVRSSEPRVLPPEPPLTTAPPAGVTLPSTEPSAEPEPSASAVPDPPAASARPPAHAASVPVKRGAPSAGFELGSRH